VAQPSRIILVLTAGKLLALATRRVIFVVLQRDLYKL
jgi:hypothetical protein